MTAQFYLFDVCHGQCAALKLPNGRWCVFDLGGTAEFSPILWIVEKEAYIGNGYGLAKRLHEGRFVFYKTTVSHLHGDHLTYWTDLVKYGPEFIRTVQPDKEHLQDCRDSNTDESWPKVYNFLQHINNNYSGNVFCDYAGVKIDEMSLPVNVARQIGGDANARVNNASIVTRIDAYGNSILLCGDMMKEAWEAIINDMGPLGAQWRSLIQNIDILIAPHHGHKSGFSVDLLKNAKPAVVLVSAVENDPHVDKRYSGELVRGISIDNTNYSYISTRQMGHIKIEISQPESKPKGQRTWSFGDAVK